MFSAFCLEFEIGLCRCAHTTYYYTSLNKTKRNVFVRYEILYIVLYTCVYSFYIARSFIGIFPLGSLTILLCLLLRHAVEYFRKTWQKFKFKKKKCISNIYLNTQSKSTIITIPIVEPIFRRYYILALISLK